MKIISKFTAWVSAFVVIQSECGNMRTRITPNTGMFYAMIVYVISEKRRNWNSQFGILFLASTRWCLEFQWNWKQLFCTILRLHDRLFMASWHGFYFFNWKLYSHLAFNADISKNHVKDISQALRNKLWRSFNRSLVLRFFNARRSTFVNTSNGNSFPISYERVLRS